MRREYILFGSQVATGQEITVANTYRLGLRHIIAGIARHQAL
jgi:hypothetical protein